MPEVGTVTLAVPEDRPPGPAVLRVRIEDTTVADAPATTLAELEITLDDPVERGLAPAVALRWTMPLSGSEARVYEASAQVVVNGGSLGPGDLVTTRSTRWRAGAVVDVALEKIPGEPRKGRPG